MEMILAANQREAIRIIDETNENTFQKMNIKYSQYVLVYLIALTLFIQLDTVK